MIRLRDVTEEDSARLLAWRNLPEVARYMYSDHTISQTEHDAWFRKMMADPEKVYWIIESAGRDVGMACLYPVRKPAVTQIHCGFYIASPGERGKGIGLATIYQVLRTAFEDRGIGVLHCEAYAFNTRALKLYRSAGFRESLRIEKHSRKNGAWQDVVALVFEATDWPAAKARLEPLARRAGAA